jgi:ABC-type sugar transport system substrate-binding protein
MKRTKIISLVAVLALILAACSADDSGADTTAGATDTTEASPDTTEASPDTTEASPDTTEASPSEEDPLAEYGESTDADPTLIAKALGPIEEPTGDPGWDIVKASIARAHQDLDQAIIDKAMECWSQPECDTGTGGELVMGYADGGGHFNVWRAVSHMEAILQALTYEEIGTIVSTEAGFAGADQEMANIRFLIQRGASFIVGYPDAGAGVAPAIAEATAAGIPYSSFSAGWVGLPDQEGALVPGTDYLAVVGEDLCGLGESFSEVINENVGTGTIGVLGGSPGNALTLGWQRCHFPSLADGIEPIDTPPDENTTVGDTFWLNDNALQVVLGWLSTNPDLAGYSYEYADGLYTALSAYDQLGIPVENLTIAIRTDEQSLFCDWAERNEPTYNIWYSAGGNFQSRTSVTAAMMSLQGATIPGSIIVPHVMRQVTAEDCNPDRVNPVVSGTSLVPDDVLALMFTS